MTLGTKKNGQETVSTLQIGKKWMYSTPIGEVAGTLLSMESITSASELTYPNHLPIAVDAIDSLVLFGRSSQNPLYQDVVRLQLYRASTR